MKNNEATIFVFLASIIIGVLVSLNINFGKKTERIFLDAKQYQDAYNIKVKLQTDIGGLRNQYNHYYEKLQKYEALNRDSDEVLKAVREEITSNIGELGYGDVHGPGIKISIADASTEDTCDLDDYNEDKIIHNYDILFLINDLRAAGAEAIEINGQRITDMSEVYCAAYYLSINRVHIPAPFYITAIGNKETLKKYMKDPSNYIAVLTSPIREMRVEVESQEDIVMQANEGEPKSSYMSNVKK